MPGLPGAASVARGYRQKTPAPGTPNPQQGDPVFSLKRRGFTTLFKNETGSTVIEMGSNRSCTARMFKAWFEVAYL